MAAPNGPQTQKALALSLPHALHQPPAAIYTLSTSHSKETLNVSENRSCRANSFLWLLTRLLFLSSSEGEFLGACANIHSPLGGCISGQGRGKPELRQNSPHHGGFSRCV